MKLIVEQNDMLEGNFDEDLITDVLQVLDPLKVDVIYELDKPKKTEVISSGCTN